MFGFGYGVSFQLEAKKKNKTYISIIEEGGWGGMEGKVRWAWARVKDGGQPKKTTHGGAATYFLETIT